MIVCAHKPTQFTRVSACLVLTTYNIGRYLVSLVTTCCAVSVTSHRVWRVSVTCACHCVWRRSLSLWSNPVAVALSLTVRWRFAREQALRRMQWKCGHTLTGHVTEEPRGRIPAGIIGDVRNDVFQPFIAAQQIITKVTQQCDAVNLIVSDCNNGRSRLHDWLIDWLTVLRHISTERLLVPRDVAK